MICAVIVYMQNRSKVITNFGNVGVFTVRTGLRSKAVNLNTCTAQTNTAALLSLPKNKIKFNFQAMEVCVFLIWYVICILWAAVLSKVMCLGVIFSENGHTTAGDIQCSMQSEVARMFVSWIHTRCQVAKHFHMLDLAVIFTSGAGA